MPPIRLSLPSIALSASLIVAAFALAPAAAQADECKTIKSVKESAVASANTGDGGHVTGHIKGQTPPPNWDYTNKTLFTSVTEYNAAWKNYVKLKQDNPLSCSVGSPDQAVSVQRLLKKPLIGAISCHDATCAHSNKTKMRNIFFAFIYNTDKKRWILNTAFPSN